MALPVSNITQRIALEFSAGSEGLLMEPQGHCSLWSSASLRGQDQKSNCPFSEAQFFLCAEGWTQKRELPQSQSLQRHKRHSAALTEMEQLGANTTSHSTRPSRLLGEKVRCCQETTESREMGYSPFFLKRVDVPGTQGPQRCRNSDSECAS